jgi:hypothetical protein
MANVTVNKINTNYSEDYTEQDLRLIPSFDVVSQFTPETDEVEFSIYNEQGLLETINYDYKDYTVTLDYNTNQNSVSTVTVNPEGDVIKKGYTQGNYSVVYNFFRNQLSSSFDNQFYIKQISSDRTELRIANNNIENQELERLVNEFKSELSASAYFEDFQLNFGNNNIFIANNILIDNSDELQYTVLIKLYEPLEGQFNVKDELWITLQTAEEVSYQVNFALQAVKTPPPKQLKGPNFEIQSKDIVNNSTTYQNLNSLTTVALTSSYDELQNILNQKGITVNIDYSDFNEFVYFSSAEERVRNFYYKVELIEGYQEEIDALGGLSNSQVSSSIVILENKIQDVIKNFDGYERYQYYSSGSSNIYPKSNTTAPFNLESTGSATVLAWLEDQATSGSNYDLENPDRLVNTLPSFVKDDSDNAQFMLFMDMVGQHFDNIWAYTKDVSNRFDADNRLNYGISKDIVADAIRSMGVNLYQNNFSSDDLYSALLGINASGSLLPPTGSEVIETYVTASSDVAKLDDVNKEIYKRIYHNLPYLLKKKGTVEGLRALINTYGIPDTILRISEFGGKDKDNSNDWDYFQNKFNYAIYNSGSSTTSRVTTNLIVNSTWGHSISQPSTILFRFKPDSLPTNNTQSIVAFGELNTLATQFALVLDYTGSGALTSGSYSGSIPSQSLEYGTLSLYNQANKIISCSAPFYDGNWWSVLLEQGGTAPYQKLKVANSIYNGNDGFKIGYIATSSYSGGAGLWGGGNSSIFYVPAKDTNSISRGSKDYYGLTGSFQELRFYINRPDNYSETFFQDYVMNPYSIEGGNYSSSADNLIFRAPLGSDLNTSTGTLTSIHPKISGSYITNSFVGNTSNYIIGANLTYYPQTEFIYYDQPAVGIKNRISEKIRLEDNIVPSGDTLTPYRTIQQRYPQSESYTRDVNYVEVAFSPQNEINDDINSSMGYFNIGDYIGDPRQISSSTTSYPDLDRLRDSYFDKYYKNYDWTDYVRLIKYFDNSLFKMIKDFTPAKSSVATGVVIKQHLLERNKQRPAQVEISQHDYSGSITSSFISGGSAGVYDDLLNVSSQVTQSWEYSVNTQYGPQIITQSTQDEFYNGELSGSGFIATTGELNDENPSKYPSTLEINYEVLFYTSSVTPLSSFIADPNLTENGEIYLWYDTGSYINPGGGSTPPQGESPSGK